MSITKSSIFATLALAYSGSASLSHAVLIADFDGGGVAYAEGSFEGPGAVGVTGGGPSGNYYTLLNDTGSNRNYVSFESAGDTSNWTNVNLRMDFLASEVEADGFAVALLGTATHGASGVVQAGIPAGTSAEERAIYQDSIGVGFRTFNGTNATIAYNGAESADASYALTQGVFSSIEINIDRDLATGDSLMDVTVFDAPGSTGTASNVFTDYAIAGVGLEDFRVQVTGRTGGSPMNFAFDNVNLDVTRIPEPSSTFLIGLCGIGLVLRRSRS